MTKRDIFAELTEGFEALKEQRTGKRTRWCGRASNPVGGVSHSQVGSTPAAFRHSKVF